MNKLQTVILKHDTPDGCHHFDWMFAQKEPGASQLITYKLDIRPDSAQVGVELKAMRLQDHRLKYLEYEGLLGDNRGKVSRLAKGWYQLSLLDNSRDNDNSLLVKVQWDFSGLIQHWHIINERQMIRLL